jgi:hypothetical protein
MTRIRQEEDSDAFYEFWCQYPRPVGKAAARKAYTAALKRASAGEIMRGLLAYPFSPEVQYQPHPATWLRQDRFLVEAPSAPATTAATARPTLTDTLKGIMGG